MLQSSRVLQEPLCSFFVYDDRKKDPRAISIYTMTDNNKYQKWYDHLIDRARNRTIEGYVEKHHIVPRSLGGTDEESNLVKLTAREHVIAHMLLPRFVDEPRKMWYALWCMVNTNGIKVNSRLYEQVRVEGHQKLVASPEWLESVNKACLERAKNNLEWRHNNKIAIQKLSKDPEWLRKVKEGNQKKAKDPEWLRKVKENNQKKAQDPLHRAKLKVAWERRKQKQNQDPAYKLFKTEYTKAGWATRRKKRLPVSQEPLSPPPINSF